MTALRRAQRENHTMPRTGQPTDSPEDVSTKPESDERQEDISRRAYERFQMRGCEHGRDQEDWYEAERELATDR